MSTPPTTPDSPPPTDGEGRPVPGRRDAALPLPPLFRARGRMANRRICAIFDACRGSDGVRGVRDAALVSVLFGANVPVRAAVALSPSAWNPETGILTARAAPRARLPCPRPVGPRRRATQGAREALEAWTAVRGDHPGPWFPPIRDGDTVPAGALTPVAVRRALEARAAQAGVTRWSAVDSLFLYRSPWWGEA